MSTEKWKKEVEDYFMGQPDDVINSIGYMCTIISHAYIYEGKIPPPEKELLEVLDKVQKARGIIKKN